MPGSAPSATREEKLPPGLRQTMWGMRPTDWPLVRWRAFATRGGRAISVDEESDLKQVTVRVRHSGVTRRRLSPNRPRRIGTPNQVQVSAGQFVISKIDARNGACGFIPPELDGAIVTNDFPVFDIGDAVHARYLDHVAGQRMFWRLCESVSDGTTNRVRLDLGLFDQLEFPLPPLAEQRAIAAVLDAIDETIERTEEVIAATERLRDALLHELLTRGLPGRHSEWADVPGLGTVPASWDVVRLEDILVVDQPGAWGGDPTPNDPGVRVLRAADLTRDGRVDPESAAWRSLSKRDLERRSMKDGDLILERSGGGPGTPVGRVAMIRGLGPVYCNNFCQQLRVDNARCSPRYALRALWYRYVCGITSRLEHQTTGIRNLDYAAYLAWPTPLPGLEEQLAIADALDGVEASIERAREERAGLHSLQASAADALLSGHVRVRDPEHVT